MKFELDLHVHTCHSVDSLSKPKAILRAATAKKLDGIAITDHDTIKGALEIRQLAASGPVQIIVGEEVSTDLGDIIGLFVKEEVRTRDAFEAVDMIRSQGGISVLPHPFKGHRRVEELAAAVDLIETFNSRASGKMNSDAAALARSLSKPCSGGSDSHSVSEIGNCRIVVAGEDLRSAVEKGAAEISGTMSRRGVESVSQAAASLRRGHLHKVPLHLGKAALRRLGKGD